MSILGTTSVAFIAVFLKAFQQRNVAFDRYLAIMPTSILLTASELWVIVDVVGNDFYWPQIVAVGLGSGLGCLLAMKLHGILFKEKVNG